MPHAIAPVATQLSPKLRSRRLASSVDLTAVEGINVQTAMVWLSEVGPDLSKLPTPEHFASWLGLCPDNRIAGGRKISAATRAVANRLATALRLAAQSLHRVESALGEWFRRLKPKLGPAGATTAAAHKLARVLYAMIKYRQPFDPHQLGNPALRRRRKEHALRRQASELGYTIAPIQTAAVSQETDSCSPLKPVHGKVEPDLRAGGWILPSEKPAHAAVQLPRQRRWAGSTFAGGIVGLK